MYDVDGNKYLDFINSWGPMILGHNNPLIREAVIKACEKGLSYGAATEKEVEMAELITGIVPSIDMVLHGKLRNRGCHERSPGGQRLHRKKQDCEIHGLLPWPL